MVGNGASAALDSDTARPKGTASVVAVRKPAAASSDKLVSRYKCCPHIHAAQPAARARAQRQIGAALVLRRGARGGVRTEGERRREKVGGEQRDEREAVLLQ